MEQFELIQNDTTAWQFLVRVSFYISLTLTILGILFLPGVIWAKGYVLMGLCWCIFSAFSYAKTVRDAHEAKKLLNRLNEAQAEKILQEFE